MTRNRLRQRSSTFDLLKGSTYSGRKIAGVYRGSGTTRMITFVGGGEKKVSRADLHELAKLSGFMRYHKKFKGASFKGKREMVRKSEKRQTAMFNAYRKRLGRAIVDAPAHTKAGLVAQLQGLKRKDFGSPHVGKRPVSSLSARPGHAFVMAKKAGVRFVERKRGMKTRTIVA